MGLTKAYQELRTEIATIERHIITIEEETETIRQNRVKDAIEHMSRSVSNSRDLLEQLFLLATTDGVTGLRTRAYFNEQIEQYKDRTDLACLLTDIDHFKRYNDCYGHPQGDIALRSVATSLKKYGNPNNIFRYGGEEYIVLLVEDHFTQDSLFLLAEQIRIRVETTMIPLMTPVIEKTARHVTISIGGAIRQADEPLERLISRADQALYEAKKTRNTVKISA